MGEFRKVLWYFSASKGGGWVFFRIFENVAYVYFRKVPIPPRQNGDLVFLVLSSLRSRLTKKLWFRSFDLYNPGLDKALDSLHQIKTVDVLKALMNLKILKLAHSIMWYWYW